MMLRGRSGSVTSRPVGRSPRGTPGLRAENSESSMHSDGMRWDRMGCDVTKKWDMIG